MPDWDEDSPRLRQNLARALGKILRAAEQREVPTTEAARRWHILIMEGLNVPDSRLVGAFRGEPGLEKIQVRVGANYGVAVKSVLVPETVRYQGLEIGRFEVTRAQYAAFERSYRSEFSWLATRLSP